MSIQNRLQPLIPRYRIDPPVYVTRPTLRRLDDFRRRLEPAWESI